MEKENIMREFNYFQPTEIRFGSGKIKEAGEAVARYGKRCFSHGTGGGSSMDYAKTIAVEATIPSRTTEKSPGIDWGF